MLNKKIVAIIQARMNSTRLPGKVMKKIGDKYILEILVSRLKKSSFLDSIVIATTTNDEDVIIEALSKAIGVHCYRGSEENVLERYAETSNIFGADVLVRVTSDNPLTDVELMDKLIETHLNMKSDYTYCSDAPLGLSTEIISSDVINYINLNANTKAEREHVTLYILNNSKHFKILKFNSNLLNQDIRLTVDTEEDLKLMHNIFRNLGDLDNIKTNELIEFLNNNPEICKINALVKQKTQENTEDYPRIAFISDGNSKMGLGHIYKSLTLAKELKKKLRLKIYFLTHSDDVIIKKIEENGLFAIKLDNHIKLVDILKKLDINAIIIDKLDFKDDILRIIANELNIKIVIVDNLNSKNDKYADILINALVTNNFINKNFFDENINTEYFCGPKYLILRDEFITFKNKVKIVRRKIENILLIFGGSDPSDLTSKVLEKWPENLDIIIDVVIGPKFRHSILDEISNYEDIRLNVYNQPNNIAELMYNADLVITSPGISMFEALLVGTPVIAITQNSLQEHCYSSFNYDFILSKYDIDKLSHFLYKISSFKKRHEIIENFKKMEIGEGKEEIILKLSETVNNNELQD